LCEDGHPCRAGEVVAYCSIGLRMSGARVPRVPFSDEHRDFQIAFATPVAGRLTQAPEASEGGFLDRLNVHEWAGGLVIGHVACSDPAQLADVDPRQPTVRTLMLAGRRALEMAEIRAGLLSGWYDRSRAWWNAERDAPGSLVCLGMCDIIGAVRGERSAFIELFEALPGPAHIAYYADDALVHRAAVVSEQLSRTPDEVRAILSDFAQSFAAQKIPPRPVDWMYASAILAALCRSPLDDRFDVLTGVGLRRIESPQAIFMSVNSENVFLLRHKRLGYALQCHPFRILEAGPAVHAWLRNDFEQVRYTPDDIRRDLTSLIDTVRARSDTRFFIANAVSMHSSETIHCYAAFQRPLGKTLGSVHQRELNLMLHELSRDRDIAILDVDAIAADLGIHRHVPDGLHGSGPFQDQMRRELVRLLRERKVGGFSDATERLAHA